MLLALVIAFAASFLVTHLALSHGKVRQDLVGQLGTFRFRALYSFVAVGTFLPAVVVFWVGRPLGPVLWQLPRWLELAVALPLTLLAVLLVVLAFATPSPVSMVPARPEVRGVLRVTRHPFNMGMAAFGLAHLVANGTLGEVVFFGCCFVLVGLVGAFHQDARIASERGEVLAGFLRQTSVVPFAALLLRRTRLVPSELPLPMVVVAVAGWVALVLLHGRLFGAALL